MSTRYLPLIELSLSHEYHDTGARDVGVEFVVPPTSRRLLERRRLLIRTTPTRLQLLCEASSGVPTVALSGDVLTLGLRATTPLLHNYTVPLNADGTPLLRLAADGTLKRATTVRLTGEVSRHALGAPRPVTARALSVDGAELAKQVCLEHHDSALIDLVGTPWGRVRLELTDAGGARTSELYLHPELREAGLVALLELPLRRGLAASPVHPTLRLAARRQHLSYYLVSRGYEDADAPSFEVKDEGHVQDTRAEILFETISHDQLTDADLAPSLLAPGPDAHLVVVRSVSKLPRSAKGRRGLRLSRDGVPIIEHLPQPGPDNATCNVIVTLPKP